VRSLNAREEEISLTCDLFIIEGLLKEEISSLRPSMMIMEARLSRRAPAAAALSWSPVLESAGARGWECKRGKRELDNGHQPPFSRGAKSIPLAYDFLH